MVLNDLSYEQLMEHDYGRNYNYEFLTISMIGKNIILNKYMLINVINNGY